MNKKLVAKSELGSIHEDSNGGLHITLKCPTCGKPLHTSKHFGFDCEDHCGEKAYNKLVENIPDMKSMDNFLSSIMPK